MSDNGDKKSFFARTKEIHDDAVEETDAVGLPSFKTHSNLGREMTSVKGATEELFVEKEWENPTPFIDDAVKEERSFYGLGHAGNFKDMGFSIPDKETTHEIYIGSTGTGKGVLIGNRVLEAIRKNTGVIIIDPKKDSFLPQIIQDELDCKNRSEDFQICAWPDNFGYMAINDFDTYIDISNKFIDALDLQESGEAGVDYYKKNSRVLLKKVLKLFFNGSLGVIVKKDFKDILKHLQLLKEDMEKQKLLDIEMSKFKSNANLILVYSKRFYDWEKIEKVYWDTTTIETLDGLSKSVAEIAESAEVFSKYTLQGALYENKVLYLKVDMLDTASLKMVKMMVTDAIQQARKKKANTVVICDELSFYANSTIAGALATVRSMGLKFILALQDLSQMKEENIRNAILSNCNVKVFYKVSDKGTLEWVEKIGGVDLVTSFGMGNDADFRVTQMTEGVLNATRIRAMPRQSVAIVIAEALPHTQIIKTNYVKTIDNKEFDWSKHEVREEGNIFKEEQTLQKITDEEKIANFKISMEETNLLENSDIFGISYTSNKIGTEEEL